jgi:hypothetical protein
LKFTQKQITLLSENMDRIGEVVHGIRLDQPQGIGLAKAYALLALAYAEASGEKVNL